MSARTLHRWPSGPVTIQAWTRSAGSRLRGGTNGKLTRAPVTIVIGLMAAAVTTKTTELGDSRVRVEVEVPSEALERELERRRRARPEMRVPGFRTGKVPATW